MAYQQLPNSTTGLTGAGDVKMEDMNDLKEALPPKEGETPPPVQSGEAAPMPDTSSRNGSPPSDPPLPPDTLLETGMDQIMDDITASTGQTSSPLPPLPADISDGEATKPAFNEQIYETLYSGKDVPLKDIGFPPEAEQRPDIQGDIFAAYLKHATFTVKIWTNYDAAEKVFFQGQRLQDCGLLQGDRDVLKILSQCDPSKVNFQHIRLDVGTAFRTLVIFQLDVEHGDDGSAYLDVKGKYVTQDDQAEAFDKFMRQCFTKILETGLQAGENGIAMKDLKTYASFFKRAYGGKLARKSEWEQPLYGFGEWAGMKKPDPLALGNEETQKRGRKRWVETYYSGLKGGAP